jgi:alkane 1-monooxygenase
MLVFLIALPSLALFTLLPLIGLAHGLPWLALAVSFVAIPVADAVVGRPRAGMALGTLPARFARWIPRAQVPLQLLLVVQAVRIAPTLSAGELLVFAFAVGTVTGGTGITIAHELGHRASRLDRWLSKLLLVTVAYGHFFVEHNRGHHVRVATEDDPASAPRGMSVYRFMLRSVTGSFAHAWKLEAMRLERLGRTAWHLSNWTLSGSLLALALALLATAVGGALGMLLFLVQAAWAVALLEIVNYVEHYGLRRRRLPTGRHEPVAPRHSWNADFIVTNWLLFNLQLHSDHHAHVERPYERLRSLPDVPQLPAGYSTMVLVAMLPPLWFALMDRRLPAAAAA